MELERQIILLMAFGIFAIIFLETVALFNGVNGTIFSLAMAAIGAIIVQAANLFRNWQKARVEKYKIAMNHHTTHTHPNRPPRNHSNNLQGWKR